MAPTELQIQAPCSLMGLPELVIETHISVSGASDPIQQ